jgi:hypothetical protein
MFSYSVSLGYTQRWSAADDRAWERAMGHYLADYSEFSDIQDARPRRLWEFELERVDAAR